MKNNKEMAALYSRDKNFNRIELIIMVLPIIYFLGEAIGEVIGLFSGIYGTMYTLPNLHMDSLLPISCVSIIILQLMKWYLYEGEATKYADLALPVSSKTRVMYDLRVGCKLLLFVNLMYPVIYFVGTAIEISWYINAVSKQFTPDVMSIYRKDYILSEMSMFLSSYLWPLTRTLLFILLTYTMLVLGKYISAKYSWAFAYMACSMIALYTIAELSFSIWAKIDASLVFPVIWKVMDVIVALLELLLIIGSVRLSCNLAHKRDVARHGAYYFKAPRWIVCIVVTGIVIAGAWVTFMECSTAWKSILSVCMTVVLAGGVFYGMVYLTAERHA